MDDLPGLADSSGDVSDKVGLHELTCSEASSQEDEKELSNLTDDWSSEEEESPKLEEPQKWGPLGGFCFRSSAGKVRGIPLECNPACQ